MKQLVLIFHVGLILTQVCSMAAGGPINEESPTAGWAGKKADIYFVLDSSSSIWIVDYHDALDFVSDMVKEMDIGPNTTRVGLGIFSENFREFLPLDNGRTKSSLVEAIQDAPYHSGVGYISRAIEGVRKLGLSPNITRKGVPKILVLLTDGESRHKQLTIDNVALAKKDGIHIYTVGIGRDVDTTELSNMASDPKAEFAFFVTYFYDLHTIKERLKASMLKVEFLQGDEASCIKTSTLDVIFVYDEYVMGQKMSKQVVGFIKSLVQQLNMDSDHVRVGVISKTCQEGDISLVQYLKRKDFLENLGKETGPYITDLMKEARLKFERTDYGTRIHAKKRIVLFLAEEIPNPDTLVDETRRAIYENIEMFVVQINSDVKKESLWGMTRKSSGVLVLDSASDLDRPEKRDEFSEAFCRGLN